jgi:hypothetical protein
MDAADDLYVYEVAGLFGIGEPERGEKDPELAHLSPSARHAIERLRADAEGRPPPDHAGPGAGASTLMQMGT